MMIVTDGEIETKIYNLTQQHQQQMQLQFMG